MKKVFEFVKMNNMDAKLIAHPDHPITNLQSHLDLYSGSADNVLKCLCFVSRGRPLVVIASGEVRISMKKLQRTAHFKEVRMARRDELQDLFGRLPGGVDALTVPPDIPVFIDEKLLEKEWVVGSAGSPCVGLKLAPSEITKFSHGTVVDVAEDK